MADTNMTIDMDWINQITTQQLFDSLFDELKKEDHEYLKKQKMPKKRSPQEAYRFRMLFENTFDSFRFRLSEHYSTNSIDSSTSYFRTNLQEMSTETRNAILNFAIVVPYSMTKALVERTGQVAKSEDIGKFSIILSVIADSNKEIVKIAMEALHSLQMLRVLSYKPVLISGYIMREINDISGKVDTKLFLEAANQSSGEYKEYFDILFRLWHKKHKLSVP